MEVYIKGGAPQAIGGEIKEASCCRILLEDNTVRTGAEAGGRMVEEPIAISAEFGVDAPDAGDQSIDMNINLRQVRPLEEHIFRTSIHPAKTQAAIEVFQVLKDLFERRGKRLHLSTLSCTANA
ncbi:hypothetical protein SAMN04488571_101324 [Methanoculleus thermophilus]|jgi:hypothetical protein|uniref:Uncharacterized protein n=1 Tax=Methanoculleus thermophilus TaxID=2200 RepID=A0A1G8XA48_9EURY|nr:hypothetical protein SAMN04488571_101324 [Methanoculleus thermophilus]